MSIIAKRKVKATEVNNFLYCFLSWFQDKAEVSFTGI
jgi:hypothetical protein